MGGWYGFAKCKYLLVLLCHTFVFISLLSLSSFSGSAWSQGLGSMVGTITDPSDALIAGAKVTATEVGTGFIRTAVTNAEGYYVLASLRPAQYDLTIEATG